IPGTLRQEDLERRLIEADAVVVIKLGRNLPKVRRALERTGRLHRALYVERGTMTGEMAIPFAAKPDDCAPYFAMVLVPGWEGRLGAAGLRWSGLAPEMSAGSRGRRMPLWPLRMLCSATDPISTARQFVKDRAGIPLTIARKRCGHAPRSKKQPPARASRWCVAAIPAYSRWRRRFASRSNRVPPAGARSS